MCFLLMLDTILTSCWQVSGPWICPSWIESESTLFGGTLWLCDAPPDFQQVSMQMLHLIRVCPVCLAQTFKELRHLCVQANAEPDFGQSGERLRPVIAQIVEGTLKLTADKLCPGKVGRHLCGHLMV